jgi:hypothetical protein
LREARGHSVALAVNNYSCPESTTTASFMIGGPKITLPLEQFQETPNKVRLFKIVAVFRPHSVFRLDPPDKAEFLLKFVQSIRFQS